MKHLNLPVSQKVQEYISKKSILDPSIEHVANGLANPETNIEHIITFLDESPSVAHRRFATALREIFEETLRQELEAIEDELKEDSFHLYSALLELHSIGEMSELINGILTTNYDVLLESAMLKTYQNNVDFGVHINGNNVAIKEPPRLIKLHGSFGWNDSWPIREFQNNSTLWIPPGIQKDKTRYPYNLLWGMAREILDCDVLRIIGCSLSGTDWDLLSLLYSTRHTHVSNSPYIVEVVDSPIFVNQLRSLYPYLEIRSILDLDWCGVGDAIADTLFSVTIPFSQIDEVQQNELVSGLPSSHNWFRTWLRSAALALDGLPEVSISSDSTPELAKLIE
ncbi:MAG: hypothetical protein F4X44_13295 [Gammaproteobacteria bacterium]|nr:hypothetical protein [Gammaproteobacteria bacterium]